MHKKNVIDDPFCDNCGETETLVHFFFECAEVRTFWDQLTRILNSRLPPGKRIILTRSEVIFGGIHCKLILTRVSFKTTSPCQKCKSMGRQNIIIVLWLDVSTRKMSSHHQHLVVD